LITRWRFADAPQAGVAEICTPVEGFALGSGKVVSRAIVKAETEQAVHAIAPLHSCHS